MQKYLCNHRGSGLLVAVAMLGLIAIMGVAVTNIVSTDSSESVNDLQLSQALQVGNGGIQYALDKISNGQDPTVTDKALGMGTFSVTTDPSVGTVTVSSVVGNAKKVQTVNTNFAANCVYLDVTPASVTGPYLQNMELVKTCNTSAVMTNMVLTWNWGTCAQGLDCAEDVDDDDASENDDASASDDDDDGHGKKVTICHIPPGNPSNAHTISVGASALDAHLAHGDTEGECTTTTSDSTTVTTTQVVCEGFDSEIAICGVNDGNAHVTVVKFDENYLAQNLTATSGATIDTADHTLTTNRAYVFDGFMFDQDVPEETWYNLTVNFADGSSLTKSFLLGKASAEEEEEIISVNNGYEVSGGTVTVTPDKNVELKVIGAAITCGAGGKEIDVMVSLGINNAFTSLFDNKDVDGGEVYSTTTSASDVNYVVRGTASLKSCNKFSKTYDSTNTTQVKTLINGEQAPALAGFGGQQSVTSFLAPYLDSTGKVVLASNQVIMLFELGTSGSGSASSGADFQDLVVLFSITQ